MIDSFMKANMRILGVFTQASADFAELGLEDILINIISTSIEPQKVSEFFELCYANKDNISIEVLEAAYDVGEFATALRFYGLGDNERGFNMLRVLSGDTEVIPPEPQQRFLPEVPDENS